MNYDWQDVATAGVSAIGVMWGVLIAVQKYWTGWRNDRQSESVVDQALKVNQMTASQAQATLDNLMGISKHATEISKELEEVRHAYHEQTKVNQELERKNTQQDKEIQSLKSHVEALNKLIDHLVTASGLDVDVPKMEDVK